MNPSTGDRIRGIRKRRGLTQRDLARASGVALATIRNIEQDPGAAPRAETLHRLAVALKVRTTALMTTPATEDADERTAEDWADVRAALYGSGPGPEPAERPNAAGVLAVLESVRPALAENRFSAVRAVLPALIRDASALNGTDACEARSKVLNLAGWLLTQTRQWEAAETACALAADAAGDRLDAAAAANTMCWSLLRQGRLAEARDMAAREADGIEPRFSRATARELALWGRLLLGVTNAAVRDNRPGEAADALGLARAAADRIGREITADGSTTRTFGPVTVAMIAAENAAIGRQPARVLAIAATVPGGIIHPLSASRLRHQLDVAHAHVMLRQYPEAIGTLQQLRREAPEWIVQQRYARHILADMTAQRRLLTAEMRELADAVGLPL
ncbi:MAG TPA: helix-turn-helix transcriptional regulator [Streptosporangiaceae bacterium]|nr:helix-turn-helix transcriptional regulator [Streptosporangiaceae bacterium]